MMKKVFILLVLFLTIFLTIPKHAKAQTADETNHTAREEQEGKEIWEKLQARELECKNLTDDNYASLGEYFMGQMMGRSHEAMNTMMEQMMGKEGEEQIHVVMGKRLSSCDTSAQFPSLGMGFMPMMNMMLGMRGSAFAPWSFGWTKGGESPMMGYGWGSFGLGWLSIILVWALVILGVIALVKWVASSGKTETSKTPLEILKERYAKGEIDKKEFEQMKKELI